MDASGVMVVKKLTATYRLFPLSVSQSVLNLASVILKSSKHPFMCDIFLGISYKALHCLMELFILSSCNRRLINYQWWS